MEREQYALDAARVLTPHVILPVQVAQPAASWLQRLCLAIFDDALDCLRGGGVHVGPIARARDQREAWEWVLSDADSCLSFTTVCGVLHLNAEAVRRQLGQGDAGSTLPAGVSRQLRQPLSRTPSAREGQEAMRKAGKK